MIGKPWAPSAVGGLGTEQLPLPADEWIYHNSIEVHKGEGKGT